MSVYKINIDKKVLRLLGAQLYGDTPSIISELVQNAYDADATAVWITINTTTPNSIVVADNGIGMTPDEVNDRFFEHWTRSQNCVSSLSKWTQGTWSEGNW